MADKEIRVVIDGKETVSDATDKATGAVEGFVGKMKGWFKSFADFKGAWDFVADAVRKVWGAVEDSFDAYDQFVASQTRMAAQAKITGVGLDQLKDTAKKLRDEYGLSIITANEASLTTAKYAARAGDASLQSKLLATSLDLGAASGLSAAETMEALNQGLRGQEEGFEKLLGKNPSTLWKEYAAANDLAVGKMTHTQQRLAEITAVMTAGEQVHGLYNSRLQTGAGQQDLLNNKLQNAEIAFGAALQPLRLLVLEMSIRLMPTLQVLAPYIGGVLVLSVTALGKVYNNLYGITGLLVSGLGMLTQNSSLQVWGSKAAESATKFGATLNELSTKASAMMAGTSAQQQGLEIDLGTILQKGLEHRQEIKSKADLYEKAEQTKQNKLLLDLAENLHAELTEYNQKRTKDFTAANEKLTDVLDKSLSVSLNGATNAIKNVRDALEKAQQKAGNLSELNALKDKTDGYIKSLELMNDAHDVLIQHDHGLPPKDAADRLQEIIGKLETQASDELLLTGNQETYRLRQEQINALKSEQSKLIKEVVKGEEEASKKASEAKEHYLAMAQNVLDIASGLGDAAAQMGVLSSEAKKSLDSVIAIGDGIVRMMGGDVIGGTMAIVSAVANVVGQLIAGDAARKQLIRENNTQLERLRNELGNLSLDVTGDTFAGVQDALKSVAGQLKNGRGAQNQADVLNALTSRGLSFGDLKKVADELGIRIVSDSGALSVDGLQQLLSAMSLVELGKFGQDYSSQKQSTEAGFNVNKTGDLGQIGALGELGARFSGALKNVVDVNDLAGTRTRLQSLFQRMNDGGLSAAELGGLKGSEFLDLLTNIIGRIDSLQTIGGTSSGTGTGNGMGSGTGSGTGTGTGSGGGVGYGPSGPSTKTLDDVLTGITAQTDALAEYHTAHLSIARDHLTESRIHTELLGAIVANTAGMGGSSDTAFGKQILVERRLAGAAGL